MARRGVDLDTYNGPAGWGGVIYGGENHTEPLYLFGNPIFANGLPVLGHVLIPQHWGHAGGVSYYANFASSGLLTAGNAHELADYGWTTTALSHVTTATGDFLSAADDTPQYLDFGASGDLLNSPVIFGDYAHGLLASKFLGAMPTTLNFECYAAWPTASANETTSGFGFAAATVATAANQSAFIHSNGTNFRLRSAGGVANLGAAVDANWHTFKVSVGSPNMEWWIDGVSQGVTDTALDLWPSLWGCHSFTTNRIRVAWVRVWYS